MRPSRRLAVAELSSSHQGSVYAYAQNGSVAVRVGIPQILVSVKVRDIISLLEHDGWRLARTRGSHHHYKHPTKPGVVTVPGTGNDDVAPGTLRSIFEQAGLMRPSNRRED